MKKRTGILLLVILFLNVNAHAQIVNIGKLTISSKALLSSKFNFDNTSTATLLNDGQLVVFADFNNDGLVFFTDNVNSGAQFLGMNNQKITGSSPAEFTKFNNVIFDNNSKQPAIHVIGNISVSGRTDFNHGIVGIDKNNGSIVYETDATHFNAYAKSHIDGYVEKVGNTNFTYPIGDNSYYRSASIIPTIASTKTSIKAKYFFENSNLRYLHSRKVGNLEQIDDREYWEIDSGSKEIEVMITLSWDEKTTSEFIWKDIFKTENDIERITIVRWDNDQKLWVDEGGVAEIGANGIESGTVTTFSKVSGFGLFALAKTKRSTNNDGKVFVYNAVSPNNDGKNDFFKIDGIKNYPNNQVSIYNRWGAKVFETKGYDSHGNVFDGYAQFQGKSAANHDNKLPTGTYFYVLRYEVKNEGVSNNIEKVGYLYLNDD